MCKSVYEALCKKKSLLRIKFAYVDPMVCITFTFVRLLDAGIKFSNGNQVLTSEVLISVNFTAELA